MIFFCETRKLFFFFFHKHHEFKEMTVFKFLPKILFLVIFEFDIKIEDSGFRDYEF